MVVFIMFIFVILNVGLLKLCLLIIRNILKNMFIIFIFKTIFKLIFENLKFSLKFLK